MKHFISIYVVPLIVFLLGSCSNVSSEKNDQNSETTDKETLETAIPTNPYDGLYEWEVLFADLAGSRYREEIGCEIVNGKLVNAIWYGDRKNSPLEGSLDGNILTLSGKHTIYSAIWIKCSIDMRTGRGTIAMPTISQTNVRYNRLN